MISHVLDCYTPALMETSNSFLPTQPDVEELVGQGHLDLALALHVEVIKHTMHKAIHIIVYDTSKHLSLHTLY